jgi:hypothetical protein
MQRYFVRYTPTRPGLRSQFYAVHAKSYLEAAWLAADECDLDPEDFDSDDCLAVSRECIPLPGEVPHDLRYVPVQHFLSVPWTCDNGRRAQPILVPAEQGP